MVNYNAKIDLKHSLLRKGTYSMITMDDIIREGNPTLREVAKVSLPLSEEDISLGKEMLEFLKTAKIQSKLKNYTYEAVLA